MSGILELKLEIDGKEEARLYLETLKERIEDTEELFNDIADFLQGASKFKVGSMQYNIKKGGYPAKFADLTAGYKKKKLKKWGFVYPILSASKRLFNSLKKQGGESIRKITDISAEIGTSVPYAYYHQEKGVGKRKIKRPFITIDAKVEKTTAKIIQLWLARNRKY